MKGWLIFLIAWMGSIPSWASLYGAYKFRRFRSLSRAYLLRGVLFVVGYGAFAVSFLIPSRLSVLTESGGICIFAGVLVGWILVRKALMQIAADAEEAKKFEQAAAGLNE
jgi:hypothetical protein